eukprot:CAMPEP_0201664462 /NCGR_PEP_ID=MMETSP0494-20130426/5919_1 /ASSEMBLY_ACC=CAM_ASM_000839 /TAXON_ID=420259 /ORGANISM="Thalassiosira gravida, Strain GMp14c1" /LENGTH=625 /DNA_ID=CAMNT_0048143235 /DNA_START=122 /DNA_END=1996 /DNA_ORIENTATION=-
MASSDYSRGQSCRRSNDLSSIPLKNGFLSTWSIGFIVVVVSLISPTSSFSRSPNLQHRQCSHSLNHRPILSINSACQSTRASRCLAASSTSDDTLATASSGIGDTERLEKLAQLVNDALDEHGSEVMKTFNARVAVISPDDYADDDDFQQNYLRLGLVASDNFKNDQTVASLPFYDTDGSGLALAPHLVAKVVYDNVLPEGYDGWTGDIGLLAMLLLNEMARLNVDGGTGIDLPKRKEAAQSLMAAWVVSLPTPEEMSLLHPLNWDENVQEQLQSSSTKKIYRLLDDIDDDSSWLNEKVWALDRNKFPETIKIQIGDDAVEERPCFSPDGFRHAVSLVRSRSFFVDGSLRLLPYLDYANHDDFDSYELRDGGIGMLWGSAKGALLKSGKKLGTGDEVRISYGPKGPADYLLDHGFVPPMCRVSSNGAAVSAELSFEVDDADRFRDDKLDVLEYETYELAPMEPLQTFDVTGGPGSTGEPDPAMIQFLRLTKLGGKDAFLLESIFRKEIWGFVSEPVSEDNERGASTAVIDACERALADMMEEGEEGSDGTASEKERLCTMVRESEREALDRTLVYAKQEAEALDLKEYYQERRLKSLGLDSDWSQEDDILGEGGGRVPGGADYDW